MGLDFALQKRSSELSAARAAQPTSDGETSRAPFAGRRARNRRSARCAKRGFFILRTSPPEECGVLHLRARAWRLHGRRAAGRARPTKRLGALVWALGRGIAHPITDLYGKPPSSDGGFLGLTQPATDFGGPTQKSCQLADLCLTTWLRRREAISEALILLPVPCPSQTLPSQLWAPPRLEIGLSRAG
jgi:hypothetical protein